MEEICIGHLLEVFYLLIISSCLKKTKWTGRFTYSYILSTHVKSLDPVAQSQITQLRKKNLHARHSCTDWTIVLKVSTIAKLNKIIWKNKEVLVC